MGSFQHSKERFRNPPNQDQSESGGITNDKLWGYLSSILERGVGRGQCLTSVRIFFVRRPIG